MKIESLKLNILEQDDFKIGLNISLNIQLTFIFKEGACLNTLYLPSLKRSKVWTSSSPIAFMHEFLFSMYTCIYIILLQHACTTQ